MLRQRTYIGITGRNGLGKTTLINNGLGKLDNAKARAAKLLSNQEPVKESMSS